MDRQLPDATRVAPGHLQGILERLRTRSGLTAERLRTTDVDVGLLHDLPEVQRIENDAGLTSEEAIVEAVRQATRTLAVKHLVVADAALALRLLPAQSVSDAVRDDIYADDLGDRRNALVQHWDELFGAREVADAPPRPTVRQLRAALESAALAEVAAVLAQASASDPGDDPSGVRGLINDLLRCRDRLDVLSREHPSCEKLFTDRLNALCRDMSVALNDLSADEVTVNPDAEIMFAFDCLQVASKSIRAVSYEEDEFWTQPQGESYFEAQKRLLKERDGFEITRLFVVKSDASPRLLAAYRSVIAAQLEAGFTVGVIELPVAEHIESKLDDFILYDDSFVRYAHADRTDDERGLSKTATLSVNPRLAQQYLDRFRVLETAAIPAERYLAREEPAV